MNDLNIEQFSPKKAELITLAESYKGLQISGVADKVGYKAVDEARKDLKKKRVEISKTGKTLREDAVAFQKKVIATEKELIELIEPIELELERKQKDVDELILMEKRKAVLPHRIEKLKNINVDVPEDFVLLLDDAKFLAFYNEKHSEKLAADQAKLEEEKAKLAAEAKRMEEEKRLEVARQEARKKAEEDAAKVAVLAAEKAEKEKRDAIAAEQAKAEAAKQAFIREQQLKEEKRLADIEAEKQSALKKEQEAQLEQAKLEKRKKYQEFLASHNYVEGSGFHIEKTADSMVLFKKIGEFKI